MQIRFTDQMLKCIVQHVYEARMARGILDVYKAAEIIRLEFLSDNVAREDIVEKLVLLAGSAFVPIEFNKHALEIDGAYFDTSVYLTNDSFVNSLERESIH